MTELLHITERTLWTAAQPTGEYRMSTRDVTLEEEGFIHCSLPHQLRPVAEHLYGEGAVDDLVVLVIDSERLTVPWRFEALEPGAESYPHLYGALSVTAVTAVIDVGRDAAGRLVLPE